MIVIKNQWEVKPIQLIDAKGFIEENHYSHGSGDVVTSSFGLFYKGDRKTLHGIALWNPPPYGAAIKVSDNHKEVLALTRFCLTPNRPENSGSFLIGNSIKELDKRYKTLLTYADTVVNHDGGLYRAANWNYDNLTGKNPVYWDDENNCMVSRKKGKRTYNKAEMEAMGFRLLGYFAKHRFIYPRGNRKNIIIKPRNKEIVQTELNFTDDGRINILKN